MKILRTFILTLVLVFAGILWGTREEWMISQSAFALSSNSIWYWLMHLSIILTFILEGIQTKKWSSWLVAGGSAGILAFDMYNYPMLHNTFTAFTMASAVFHIIYHAGTEKRPYAILNCFVGTLLFLLGLLSGVHLYFGEVIAEFAIGVAMVRKIWRKY